MAQKTIYTDDLDGTEGAETVTFALEGRSYAIDLNTKNRIALEKALQKYIDAGRELRGAAAVGVARKRGAPKQNSDVDSGAIRVWAAENNVTVNAKGRIPAAIVEQYRAAVGR